MMNKQDPVKDQAQDVEPSDELDGPELIDEEEVEVASKRKKVGRSKKNKPALLQWFIVTCGNGKEDSVIADLKNTVKAMHFEESVVDVKAIKRRELISEEFDDHNPRKLPPSRMKNSKNVKWKTVGVGKYMRAQIVDRNKFPGYIYVRMVMSAETWYAVRNAPKISGLVGSSGRGAMPIPITNVEELLLAGQTDDPNLRVVVTDNAILEMDRTQFDEKGNPVGFDGANEVAAEEAGANESFGVQTQATPNESVFSPDAREALSTGSKLMPEALDHSPALVTPQGDWPEIKVGHTIIIDVGDYAGISGQVTNVNDQTAMLTVQISILGKTLLIPVSRGSVRLAH